MKCPTREQIETAVKAKGYKWFENGDYNLNIVGVRNSETLEEVTKDSDELEPRAKGEKDFKKMHDDNTEIHDEEKNDEENFKNIKKSADAIKK